MSAIGGVRERDGGRSTVTEAIKPGLPESGGMQHLIVHGDPGIRKGAVVEFDGEELVCFQINRQGDYHGPDEVQLWCVVGAENEHEAYQKRQYVPNWLDVDAVDAEALTVLDKGGSELTV